MTREIFENYKKIFGEFPNKKTQINLVPVENNFGRWEAETRGDTLTIISGDMPFQNAVFAATSRTTSARTFSSLDSE